MAGKKCGGISPDKAEQTRARSGARVGDRTALQLSRQEQVFELRVLKRMTVRQVADALSLSQETVIADERAELQRRAQETEKRREFEKEAHLALIDDLYLTAKEDRGVPGSGAYGAASKALEMRAKILGLDAPTKIEVGVQSLLEALNGGSEEA